MGAVRAAWDAAKHPRGPGGRFAKKGEGDVKAAAKTAEKAAPRKGTGAVAAAFSRGAGKGHIHSRTAKPLTAKPSTAMKPAAKAMNRTTTAHGSLHDRVDAAYEKLAPRSGGDVRLTAIRAELKDVSRADLDKTLLQMDRDRRIQLEPDPDRLHLTAADRESGIRLGGEQMHLVVPGAKRQQQRLEVEAKAAASARKPSEMMKPRTPRGPRKTGDYSVEHLQSLGDRKRAHEYLADATKAELEKLHRDGGSTLSTRSLTKEKLRTQIVEKHVGRKADSDAINRVVLQRSSAPKPSAPSPVKPAAKLSPSEVEQAIVDAHKALTADDQLAEHSPSYVMLEDIRKELPPGVSRDEVDAALRRLDRQEGVHLAPEPNQKVLTVGQRQGAIRIGNQDQHLIAISRRKSK